MCSFRLLAAFHENKLDKSNKRVGFAVTFDASTFGSWKKHGWEVLPTLSTKILNRYMHLPISLVGITTSMPLWADPRQMPR